MPNLSNLTPSSTTLLLTKNLDLVDLSAVNVSCDTLSLNGQSIDSWMTTKDMEVSTIQSKTSNLFAVGTTTEIAETIKVDTIKANVASSLSIASPLGVSTTLSVGTSTLYVDPVAQRIEVGKTNPTCQLDISSDMRVGGVLTSVGNITTNGLVYTLGVPKYYDTVYTANSSATAYVWPASGTIPTWLQRSG